MQPNNSSVMRYLLRVGLLIVVGSLPLSLRAQQLDATDTAEIQQRALRHVRQFEGLLNVISQSDEYFRKYSFDQLIRNYYSEASSYQIFRDSLVVIEDDLNPKEEAKEYGNLLTIKDYLKAFFSLYEKSPPPSVVFTNYEVAKVQQDEFLYVEVFYDSKFRNKHRAFPDLTYPVRHKRATIKAEPQEAGWRVTITDIGYARPGDRRPPLVATDSTTTTAPVAITHETEERRPDSTATPKPRVPPGAVEKEAIPLSTTDESEPTDTVTVATASNGFENTRRVYRRGKTYPLPVRVNPTVPPTSLMLYQGAELVRDFSSSLTDSTFAWQLPRELPTGDNYQLRLYDPVSEQVVESSLFVIQRKPRWPWIVGGVGAAVIMYVIVSSGDDGGGTTEGEGELPAPPSPE